MAFIRSQIHLKKGNGGYFSVDVSNETTIDEVKALIQKTHGIPFTLQRLIYAGKALENSDTIGGRSLNSRSLIHFTYPKNLHDIVSTVKKNSDRFIEHHLAELKKQEQSNQLPPSLETRLEPHDPITQARITERTEIALAIAMQSTQFPQYLETIISDYLNDLDIFNVNFRDAIYRDNLERTLSIIPRNLASIAPTQKERGFLIKYFTDQLSLIDTATGSPLAPRAILINILAKLADFALLEALANGLHAILKNAKYAGLLSNPIYMQLLNIVNVTIYDNFKSELMTKSVRGLNNISKIEAILEIIEFYASQLNAKPSLSLTTHTQSLAMEIQNFVNTFRNNVLAPEKNYQHSLDLLTITESNSSTTTATPSRTEEKAAVNAIKPKAGPTFSLLTPTQLSGSITTRVIDFLNNECKKMGVKPTITLNGHKINLTINGQGEKVLKCLADHLAVSFNHEFKMPPENNFSGQRHYSLFSSAPKEGLPVYTREKIKNNGNEVNSIWELVVDMAACHALVERVKSSVISSSTTSLTSSSLI